MGMSQPAEVVGQRTGFLWPDHKVPVIAHQAVREYPQRAALMGLKDDPVNGRVVLLNLEPFYPAKGSIGYMVNPSARAYTCFSRHE